MKLIRPFISSILVMICIAYLSGPRAVSATEHKDASFYMMRMINDARKSPDAALSKIGMDKTAVQANLGTAAWILDQGLAPVAGNNKLYQAALAHAQDMVANLYYSYQSLNGDTVEDRIAATGYNFVLAGESLGILSFDKYIDPIQAAEIIFDNMLAYELGPTIPPDHRNILNEDRTETGVAFVSTMADLGLGVPVNIYLVVADMANPVYPRGFIIGNVSVKTADYPAFKINNALAGQKLDLVNLSGKTTIHGRSVVTGFFQFDMPFGFLLLDAKDEKTGDLLVRKHIFGQTKNILLDIFIEK
jgi:hypothetical protein